MDPMSKDKIFIFSPNALYDSVMVNMSEEFPFTGSSKRLAHDMIAWGIKKAFTTITGYEVEGFKNDDTCQMMFDKYRFDFERFVFSMGEELGPHLSNEHSRYNLVLTYEQLYVISY